jgi:hypothetical protein
MMILKNGKEEEKGKQDTLLRTCFISKLRKRKGRSCLADLSRKEQTFKIVYLEMR